MTTRILRTLLAATLAGALMQSLPARADDYTDIWWAGPAEDGWGVNLIQSQDFIFATFFVYGPAPAKTPIWYAGNLTRSGNRFTGGVYQTMGTGIGAPWNPADHPTNPPQVGTATFTPTSTTTGTLVYNVNAAMESKSIVRQTLTPIALACGDIPWVAILHCARWSSLKTSKPVSFGLASLAHTLTCYTIGTVDRKPRHLHAQAHGELHLQIHMAHPRKTPISGIPYLPIPI